MRNSRRLYPLLTAAWLMLAGADCGASVIAPAPEAVATAGDRFDFQTWGSLLERYVDGKGRVDYRRLKDTAADAKLLERLYAQVAAQKIAALGSPRAEEAFYLDAYNVLVWKSVLARLPGLKSVNDAKLSFFYTTKFIVAGKETSLYSLEGDVIRPRFSDPRVHMALNCASGGCPALPAEAFVPERLDAQLDREAARFCNEERNVAWDAATKTVRLSQLFDWYAKDFGGKPLEWINARRPADRRIPLDAKVKFVDYDWRLNDPSLPR